MDCIKFDYNWGEITALSWIKLNYKLSELDSI